MIKISNSKKYYDSLASDFRSISDIREQYICAIDQEIIACMKKRNQGIFLDVGCGDGVRARRISDATGWSSICVDNSEQMIKLAERINSNVRLVDFSKQDACTHLPSVEMVTVLWNVLGHVAMSDRRTLLRNCYDCLIPNGILIMDVNNIMNIKQYGLCNVLKNMFNIAIRSKGHAGDYIIHSPHDTKISTVSHIFHIDEVTRLMKDLGFKYIIKYIDYDNGMKTNILQGQILVMAKKI